MSTKKLAKELGLLRQRSQSSNGLKKSLVSNQLFSYLIVIDFESTCWREKNNYSQEIIEFPAVLLNTSTGEVESEFHTYVQPQEHPVLSGFCTELTGITQMQVEAGIPLQICLSQFSRWLQNLQLTMGVVFPNRQPISSAPLASQKLCTFVTWSDWDLGVCLQYECKRKQLHKPDALNSWIDLRSTYRLFYDRKPKGLNGALQDLGIQFAGREHSGLDDARNTAQLAARMMRDGCVMKITRNLVRAPLMVKPMFGNTTAHNKKEKSNNATEENTLATNKPLLSMTSPKSCRISLCSELITRDLNTKKNSSSAQESVQICQSLISPKTLLNGTTPPLWGRSVTNISPLVMRNCPSPHSSSNTVVLCSTTVGCLSNNPQLIQPSVTGATVGRVEEEEGEELFLVEAEDRCGSYDDVVLEGHDDVIIGATEGKFDSDYVSDFDSGCHVWEEPDNTRSSGGQVTLRDNMRETKSVGNNFKTQEMTSEKSMTARSTNNVRSHLNVSNHLNEIRQHSTISESSNYFAVPKTVTVVSKSNQHKTGLKTCLQVQENSNGPLKRTKTNTPSLLRHKPFMPEKPSTPNSSFARPTAAMAQHTNHRDSKVSKSNQNKTGLKTCLQVQEKSNGPHKSDKTNTPFPFRHKPFFPEKTSTPNSSFARPKAAITQHTNHKEIPKSSFTIYTDPEKPSSPASCGSFFTSKNVLSSLSANTHSSLTNRSSISMSVKGGQRITSPLCGCGRRAKRQVVSNGGPNHGRGFYCCPVRRSGSGGRVQKGCEFFKWESALIKSSSVVCPAVGSSVSLCQINSTLSCHPPQRSTMRKSY